MAQFLADYELGKQEGRYIDASLPKLPFEPRQFELAICSHYLFLYSQQVSLEHHIDSILELTRVAQQVRGYPLVTLDGIQSPYLETVIHRLSEHGIRCTLVDSQYHFQKEATTMLVAEPKT